MGACAETAKGSVGQKSSDSSGPAPWHRSLCGEERADGAMRCCEGDLDAACESMCEGVATGQPQPASQQIVHSFPSSRGSEEEKNYMEEEVMPYLMRAPLSALEQGTVEEAELDTSCVLEWQVVLQKDAAKDFGLHCSHAKDGSNALVAVRFHEDGPVGRWNLECNANFEALGFPGPRPEHMIRVGDRIVGVNGNTKGTQYELEAPILAADCEKLKLRLQRYPTAFALVLTKGYEGQLCGIRTELKLGMASQPQFAHSRIPIVPASTVKKLFVSEILKGGLIDNWNQEMTAKGAFHMVVVAGMELLSVCNIASNPESMRRALREQKQLMLIFKRLDRPTGGFLR